MNYLVDLKFKLDLTPNARLLSVNRSIEISLDCHLCWRNRRTVKIDETSGTCFPGRLGKKHSFPGKIINITQNPLDWIYHLAIEYEPFIDTKHEKPSKLITPTILLTMDTTKIYKKEHPIVSWARTGFEILCICGKSSKHGTQANICRPFSVTCCGCSRILYTENEFWPRIIKVSEQI